MSRKSDWDIFLEKYLPIKHPTEEDFYMHETYGEEYKIVTDHIQEKGKEYCWTIVEGDNGKLYIIPGWYYVNRIGYILTTIPFDEKSREYKY